LPDRKNLGGGHVPPHAPPGPYAYDTIWLNENIAIGCSSENIIRTWRYEPSISCIN
jgi:hypothetical protein